ncbi:carbohydrate ABC transporter permease [Paenibacillus sp. CC-CFT747]|nr:carbohydrate ABC transporter permease [Paenibacillus sp. CC-CFT747]
MYKSSLGDRLFDVLNTLIMLLLFVVMVFPFLHLINYSLSDATKVSGKFLLLPRSPTFESYITMFKNPNLLHSIYISIARSVLGTALMIFITSMAGYVISRDDLIGIRFFRRFFVLTLYYSVGLIPSYLLVQKLGLTNTFWVYIVPGAVSVFNMILFKTYVESLPKELEEAALIDGASDLYLFFRIIFPLSTPVVAAISLFRP